MAEQVRRQREPRDPRGLLIGAKEKERLGIPAKPPEQDVADRAVFDASRHEPTPPQESAVPEEGDCEFGDVEALFGPRPLQTLAEQERDPEIVAGATVYALIYKAGRIDTHDTGGVPYFRSVRVARGRSKGTIESGRQQVPTVAFDMRVEERDTDYMIRFIPESMKQLPYYDVLTAPTLESVALTEAGMESLPGWAQAKLRRDGHLKCSGVYDEEARVFEQFSLGWQPQPSNHADTLARILDELGPDQFAAAVYYFLHTEASEQYAHPESIAEIRDIKPSSVMDRVNQAEQMLESSTLHLS